MHAFLVAARSCHFCMHPCQPLGKPFNPQTDPRSPRLPSLTGTPAISDRGAFSPADAQIRCHFLVLVRSVATTSSNTRNSKRNSKCNKSGSAGHALPGSPADRERRANETPESPRGGDHCARPEGRPRSRNPNTEPTHGRLATRIRRRQCDRQHQPTFQFHSSGCAHTLPPACRPCPTRATPA